MKRGSRFMWLTLGALAARLSFVASGLATVIPFQLWVCTAAGIIVASLCWLVWVGQ